MAVVDVTVKNWEVQVIQSDRPVLVDFWAGWCYWCRRLTPIFEDLAEAYRGKLKFARVDVESQEQIAQSYNILSLPTLKFFCKGRSVSDLVGYKVNCKPNLEAEIDKVLHSHRECEFF